jgi:hypothetical protein
MVSIADPVAAPPLAGAAGAIAQGAAPAASLKPAVSALAAGERELRIDLFRGLALWLIYIDHVSPDLLTWFTIRNYGFSDAAEIFIFISGYTAAFVYGRAMNRSGFVIGAARVLKRVWQIYLAHMFLLTIMLAEVCYVVARVNNPFYSQEMGIAHFFKDPGATMLQALLLRFRPLNMDVLPLYIVLMFCLPVILVLMKWRPNVTLALSVLLYFLRWRYDLYLTAYPTGFWAFNPFAWQLLFVFGAWCALGGAQTVSRIVSSRITLFVSIAYVLAAFCVTLTWYFPPLGQLMPRWLEQWIYPISKTDFDVLRFLHFLALAAITVYFVPGDWPGLKSPWLRPLVLCGQHSLEIFCLSIFLAFTGYFVLMEFTTAIAPHFLIGILGCLVMSAAAWLASTYKRSVEKSDNADFVG